MRSILEPLLRPCFGLMEAMVLITVLAVSAATPALIALEVNVAACSSFKTRPKDRAQASTYASMRSSAIYNPIVRIPRMCVVLT